MIYGERVRLRANERADLPQFVEWLSDPQVRQYLGMHMSISLANEEKWFEHMLDLPVDEQPYGIEIRQDSAGNDIEQWQLIGNCNFMQINWIARSAEVGIFIGDKTCWNKGYGTEVMRLLLRQGFEVINLNRIFLQVDEANKGGIRAYEKAGFVAEGRMRQATYQQGEYRDMLLMSVLRSEWKKSLEQVN